MSFLVNYGSIFTSSITNKKKFTEADFRSGKKKKKKADDYNMSDYFETSVEESEVISTEDHLF